MDIIQGVVSDLGETAVILWGIFLHGGFVVFVIAAVIILYELYLYEIQTQFVASQEWVFLNIISPKENLVSTLAVEQIYTQLTAIFSGITFAQRYVEGVVQLWYSFELVSMGGKISYILRVPKAFRDLVEAAFYAQYPNAEISEVNDYLENIDYNPETSDFDLWGTEVYLTDDQAFPLKTYRDFEHATAEEKIIDPLDGLLEGLGKMDPHEFYGIQMLLVPIADWDWKPEGEAKAKELLGEKPVKKLEAKDLILGPLDAFAEFSFKGLLGIGKKVGEEKKREFQAFTDIEKERVNLVQRKISKPGYLTKIRHMYIAPKDNMTGRKKAITLGLGFIRSFNMGSGNKFRPHIETNTKIDYRISPSLEEPYINWQVNKRKVNLFKGFKNRSPGIGGPKFVLNVEELATLYHLPLSVGSTVAPVEKTESKKSQPPINLPIGEM